MKEFSKNLINKVKNLILKISQKINFEKGLKKFLNFLPKYFKFILTFFIALILADLCILFIWPLFLPGESSLPNKKLKIIKLNPTVSLDQNLILSKNIFHRGSIPEFENQNLPLEGKSQPTSLPFKLLGTIESSNPQRSMASIHISTLQQSNSYFVNDIIDNKAQIKTIERRRVIFINLNNNRLEHIEIPLDQKGFPLGGFALNAFDSPPPLRFQTPPSSLYKGISKTEDNQYSINRSTINDHLQKLPDILQQARVDPKIGENGQVIGHTFAWIKKNSVFEGLGFQKGDTIISINGEKVNDRVEATELFQRFRTSSQFDVIVEDKDGKIKQLSYNIDEDASVQ